MVDDFHMSKPTFPPHPHAGISAVTYVLPESEGTHVSFDSLGQVVAIHPGDLHWFCAGRGAVHTEEPDDAPVHGLQLFINLPIKGKRNEPFGLHLNAADIPEVTQDNLNTRVVIGSYGGLTSPFNPPAPIMLLDFRSGAKAVAEVPLTAGWAGLIYVLSGQVSAHLDGAIAEIDAKHALGFESIGFPVQIEASSDARWVVLFGEALHEPYVSGGPIIMESDEANHERFGAYRRGEFGILTNYPKSIR